MSQFEASLTFAQTADAQDPLREFRNQFIFPVQTDGSPYIYLCGNSLGLQPGGARALVNAELDHWAQYGVEGHFRGDRPWKDYHAFLAPASARLAGARENEVVVMNTLTVNLHLLMVSFYRPDARRFKIVMEGGAFPSDQYAVETQVRYHGFDPAEAIVEVHPSPGADCLTTEQITAAIEAEGDAVALVMFGGVNYYTGQWYDLPAITRAAHRVGAYAGFDLAHAAGNVPLQLHDWGVDFACWCSYKYLNSGPGGPAAIFVHERHADPSGLPRFGGWWGHNAEERFQMRKGFKPMRGAEGWQLSNAQILSFAAHLASLQVFEQTNWADLRAKSRQLTGYLEYLLQRADPDGGLYRIITPADPEQRGCQLSLLTNDQGRALFDYLESEGVICDWREPNVIRFAPVPLYNSFEDVWRTGEIIRQFAQR